MTQPGSSVLNPAPRPAIQPSHATPDDTARQPKVAQREQYDGLTSLRFFAALLVVILHSAKRLGLDPDNFVQHEVALGQGVTFFFVLSGFILTRVYPGLSNKESTKNFYVARFARVFPIHCFCLLMSIPIAGMIAFTNDFLCFLATFFLLQAWVPDPRWIMFNGPDWSLSAEAFFYACFPLLLPLMRRRPLLVLAASFLPGLALLSICSPDMQHIRTPFGSISCFAEHIVTMNPLIRICEFAIGMLIALLTEKQAVLGWLKRFKLALGILCFGMIGAALASPFSTHWLKATCVWPVVVWLRCTGGILPYALLIALVSLRDGRTERILSNRILVHLGNLSFAMYLVHSPLIEALHNYGPVFTMPAWLGYALFLLILWSASEVIYALFECPARAWLVSRSAGRPAPRFHIKREAILAASVLAISVTAIVACGAVGKICLLDDIRKQSPPAVSDVNFGNMFQLRGMRCVVSADGRRRRLELAWHKLRSVDSSFVTAVHLIDATGQIHTLLDYGQDPGKIAQTDWHDEVVLPAAHIDNICAVGIGVFPLNQAENLLHIDRGPRDWGDRRLTIPITALMPNAADRQ